MIRDWYLIGEIFTAVEKNKIDELIEKHKCLAKAFEYPELEIKQHLKIMVDAGFIKGVDVYIYRDNRWGMHVDEPYVTYQGYLFMDAVADRELLSRTLRAIECSKLKPSFETIKQFSPIVVKRMAELCYKD